jgi:dTDP-4-amino-4,6-dideoxygalactose transaminase
MKDVIQYAKKKSVETLPAFRSTVLENDSNNGHSFPVAKSLLMRSLLFPLYPMLGKTNIEHIVKVISTLP